MAKQQEQENQAMLDESGKPVKVSKSFTEALNKKQADADKAAQTRPQSRVNPKFAVEEEKKPKEEEEERGALPASAEALPARETRPPKGEDAPLSSEPQEEEEEEEEEQEPPKVDGEDEFLRPHDNPKTQERIRQLLKHRQEARQEAERLRKEADELRKAQEEAAKANGKLPDDVQEQIKELQMFRRKEAFDSDPDVKRRFVEPIAQYEEQIKTAIVEDLEAMKDELDAEDQADQVKSAEFWIRRIGEMKTVSDFLNPDPKSRNTQAEQFYNALSYGTRRKIDMALMRQRMLADERESELKKAQDEAEEYFKQLREEQQAATGDRRKLREGELQEDEKWLDSQRARKIQFLTPVTVPKDATDEQKKAAQAHNAHVATMTQQLKNAMNPKDAQDRRNVALAAVAALDLRTQVTSLSEENKALKEQLRKIKDAGKTNRRRLASQGADTSRRTKEVPRGLAAALDAKEREKAGSL